MVEMARLGGLRGVSYDKFLQNPEWQYSITFMKTELVTTLKRQATKILAELHESKEPVLITEHGLPSAYLVDVNDFELMQSRMRILEGIARGEMAILENRTYSQSEAKEKMSKWLK
jgi:prevent-host-death family protein